MTMSMEDPILQEERAPSRRLRQSVTAGWRQQGATMASRLQRNRWCGRERVMDVLLIVPLVVDTVERKPE